MIDDRWSGLTSLEVEVSAGRLDLWLARPEARNAMSLTMVDELEGVFRDIEEDASVRVVVLRGRGGHFCAGGDVKDMAAARSAPSDGTEDRLATVNRRFGALVDRVDRAPQAVVAVLEGAVMGGGFGLACVADVALASRDAKFRLPETGLGLPPAQIAPFLVQRLGLSTARRLAVTGARLDGFEAAAVGLVHEVHDDADSLGAAVDAVVASILRCAPGAIRDTKAIMRAVGTKPLEEILDDAAARFAAAARGPEGVEGMTAFIQKRPPSWAPEGDA